MKFLKLKKLNILVTIFLFGIISFFAIQFPTNASVSQSVLNIAKGGTNANSAETAQINLGLTNSINCSSTDNEFPSSKAVYDYIQLALYENSPIDSTGLSMNNTNFYNTVCNWTGGDLIYKGSDLSTTAANNKIKVGDKACTTSGQGYTSNSAADDGIPQVGCVLPDLTAGTHAVTISTDGGTSYTINAGKVIYTQTPTLPNCDTTSMQTFGADAAACKAAMQQGQAIVLNDTRNNQKYRVKKMPDGNVWMIDSLRYSSGTYWDPISITYCSSSGLVHTHNPGNTTACGYLYNWATALTISPSDWFLQPINGTKSAYELSNKMLAIAGDSAGNRNPVYSTTNYRNFGEGGTGNPAPWLGVYSGYYLNNSFGNQGSWGNYWSSTEYSNNDAYDLYFGSSGLYTQNYYKTYGFCVRSVL
jgi:uncharacterized protein (TIGR02145 family)